MDLEMVAFGLVDNGILLLCMAFGLEIDRFIPLPPTMRSAAARAVLGAVIGNALSDGVAGLPGGYQAAVSVTVGCLLPLLGVPWVLGRMAKREMVCTSDDPNNHQGDTCPVHEAEWAEVRA